MARTVLWPAGPNTTEPPASTVLFDSYGGRWTRDNNRNPNDQAGKDGWTLTGTKVSIRWSSPAMGSTGPFRTTPVVELKS